jgi:hypothetical protein
MDGRHFEVTTLRPDDFIVHAKKNIFIIFKIKNADKT